MSRGKVARSVSAPVAQGANQVDLVGKVAHEKVLKYSIVITTAFDHLEDLLLPCLNSIFKNTILDDVEIIVVAHACGEHVRRHLAALETAGLPVKHIWLEGEYGYTEKTNRGVSIAKGEYVIPMNDDTVILDYTAKSEWLRMLEAPFKADDKIAVTGPSKLFETHIDRHFIVGYCFMMKRSVWNEFGGYNVTFNPGYGEDIDLCVRLVDAGYKIREVPVDREFWSQTTSFPIWHKAGSTMHKNQKSWNDVVRKNTMTLLGKYTSTAVLAAVNTKSDSEVVEFLQTIADQTYKNIDLYLVDSSPDSPGRTEVYDSFRPKIKNVFVFQETKQRSVGDMFDRAILKVNETGHEYSYVAYHSLVAGAVNYVWLPTAIEAMLCSFNIEIGQQSAYYTDHPFMIPPSGIVHKWRLLDSVEPKRLVESITSAGSAINCNEVTMWQKDQPAADKLPDGWFEQKSINDYRALINSVPNGGTIVEVGCWKGRSICSVADLVIRKGLKVICVDTFEGVDNDGTAADARRMDVMAVFSGHVARYQISENVVVRKTDSLTAAKSFKESSVDLVFIDADHSANAVWNDIFAWLPKIKRGGVICGHDYDNDKAGVRDVANWIFDKQLGVNGLWWVLIDEQNKETFLSQMMAPAVTVAICTKGRYSTTLPASIASIVTQTMKPRRIIVVDDTDDKDRINLLDNPMYFGIFRMMEARGIAFIIFKGSNRGLAEARRFEYFHSKDEWVWRIDDDVVAEPDVLEKLSKHLVPGVGAVSPLIMDPKGKLGWEFDPSPNTLNDIRIKFNYQWNRHPIEVRDVEHLYSSFIYRVSAADPDCCGELSPVSHREDTIWSHHIKRGGLRLLVDSGAVVWHLRDPEGGIRSYKNDSLYNADDEKFRRKYNNWRSNNDGWTIIALDAGIGDHIVFESILPEILKKHPKLKIGCCYPEVFSGHNVETISLADAKDILGKEAAKHNVYEWMRENKWTTSIVEAFREVFVRGEL